MKVEAADGTWHVRRRWAPRHLGSQTIWARFLDRTRKARRRSADAADLADPGCIPDLAEGVLAFVAVVAIVLLLILVGLPFLVALGELVLILVLVVAGVVGRIVFRRPWTVDAVDPTGVHYAWSVLGWRKSAAARRFIADRVAATGTVPTNEELAAALLGY